MQITSNVRRASAFSAISIVALVTLAYAPGYYVNAKALPNEPKDNYVTYCGPCHGNSGQGASAKPLWKLKQTDAVMARIISKGDGKGMPGFANDLSSKQISEIVKVIRKFSAKGSQMHDDQHPRQASGFQESNVALVQSEK